MNPKSLIQLVAATELLSENEESLDYAFAGDLMSDALALIRNHCENTLLITGLCNAQTLRTADMLDIQTILFVRNKMLSDEDLELAKQLRMNIYMTHTTMYEACGQLYKAGISPVEAHV